ncbi:MAG: hypothetical protein PQJ60_06595 [Spirochaetales bacterium]|nr:hypothetical protein [Spirochaetales bacterium]
MLFIILTMPLFSQSPFFEHEVEITITDIDFGYSKFYPTDFEYHFDIGYFKDYFENYALESDYTNVHYNYETLPILISGTLLSNNEKYQWTYNKGGWGVLSKDDGTKIIHVDPRYEFSMTDSSFDYMWSIRRNSLDADLRKTSTFKSINKAFEIFFQSFNNQNSFPQDFRELDLSYVELVYFVTPQKNLVANKEMTLPESYDPTKDPYYKNSSITGYISDPYPFVGSDGEEPLLVTISYRATTEMGVIVLAFDIRLDQFEY